MDTIWDRNSFEVGGVVAGMKKTPKDHAEPTKSKAKKSTINNCTRQRKIHSH